MVDELAAAAAHAGGLPLLPFALGELWEARDEKAGVVPRSALDAIGGVGGARAKHADSLLVTLGPARRPEARRLLVRLVTLEDPRVRRTGAELGADRPPARAALDALVRGRLVVAHEDEAGGAFELAHDVLIREWATLRRWLHEDVEKRAVRERLAAAAADWGCWNAPAVLAVTSAVAGARAALEPAVPAALRDGSLGARLCATFPRPGAGRAD